MPAFMLLYDLFAVVLLYASLQLSFYFVGGVPFSPTGPLDVIKEAGLTGFMAQKWMLVSLCGSVAVSAVYAVCNPFRQSSSSYGGAHFASSSEIQKLGLWSATGIILGLHKSKFLRYADPLSTLVYAPPGTGKTAGLVVPVALSCGNSMILHDPKHEVYEMTGPRRSEFSKVIKFAPGEKESCRWNPLSKKELPRDWTDTQTAVDRICVSLFPLKDSGDMWTREARSIFMFWTLVLIHKNGETSFPEIIDAALASGEPQEVIAEILDGGSTLPNRIVTEGNGLMAKAEKEFAGVLGTFKSAMNIFLDPNVRRNVSKSDFSLWDLRREPTTIYLCVNPNDQVRLQKLLGLFFEVCNSCNLDHIPTKDEMPVTMILDEYVQLGVMKNVNGMPAIGRGYKFNALYICQSYSQLVDLYGQTGADELKNTCSFHVYYAQNEIKVAEEVSRSIGKFTRTKKSHSSQKGSFGKNVSESDEGVPLILPQEIMSLPFGEILVCRQNSFETPVRCKAALFFKIPSLKNIIKKSKWVEENRVPMTKDESIQEQATAEMA